MLKALELVGFKSFAEKTRLDFHSGVTCVVGPNGSGKSNVVDAVKWVLGSQSPRSLRGSEMTDVIFNGAAGRRPLNAAEVTLEFDNTHKLFEVDESTIRITRRVYRSGEGEYAINGANCRLRDIRELLAGTGIGVESYNIIEQGRVDAVLRASPKDRRALFEEAAGISRFRLKKQEADRRLARVEQNLLRLSDIVDEVEGRLRRVRMQAGKARKYREQSNRLKQLRTELGLADWRVIASRLEQLGRVRAELEASHRAQASQLDSEEQQLEAIEQGGSSVAGEIEQFDQRLATARERLAARQSEVLSGSQRLLDLKDSLALSRRRMLAAQIKSTNRSDNAAAVELRMQLAEQRKLLVETREQIEEAEVEAAKQEETLQKVRRQAKQLEARHRDLGDQLAEATRAVDEATLRRELLATQLNDYASRTAEIEASYSEVADQWQKSDQRRAELQNELEEVASSFSLAKQNEADLRESLTKAYQDVARHEVLVASDRKQLASLQEADLQLDRLREEMGRLLAPDFEEGSAQAKICGLVADVIQVDFDVAPIIEAALGNRAHHLVVDNGAALLGALCNQAEPLAARASFQRLDLVTSFDDLDQVDLHGTPGVMGRADRFVEAEPEYALLVKRLLGRTWIVDRLQTAVDLAGGAGRGLSFVTYDGQSITADGQINAGPLSESAGVLTRRRQIARIEESLASASDIAQRLETQVAEFKKQIDASCQQVSELGEQQNRFVASVAEAGQRAAVLAERRDRLKEEVNKNAAEHASHRLKLAAIDDTIQAEQSKIQTLRQALASADSEQANVLKQAENHRQAHAAMKQVVSDRYLALAGCEQHVEILAAQLNKIEREAEERSELDSESIREVAACKQRVESCELSLLNARAEIAELLIVVERLTWRRRRLAESKRGEVQQRQSLARRLSETRRQFDATRSQLSNAELEIERLGIERKALSERMRDDHGIDLAQAAQAMPVAEPTPIENRETLEQEMAQLRSQVSSVGAVNLDSLEELDELEERFTQLSAQYNDLSEAKSSLERLATRISTESRQLFLATVEEVRVQFRELFRRLFGGGEADIVIVEEEGGDPLEAGVEVAASPPGKELRSISLLSGGEKTMTCVALLLAVFRTKPSPFCVLDEVDAALDEANIGRFTGVLSEFLSSTQFIVVTHSKKTMTGADTLYGVTMQESGVSKQVAVRFEDVGEDGQINPAATLRRATPQSRAA